MTEHFGRSASPGIAAGPIVFLDEAERPASPSPAPGAPGLEAAIAARIAELEGLMARLDAAAAEILAFQVEMLGDAALAEPAFAAIGEGEDAVSAWRGTLDAEIAGYDGAPDEYFQSRAADLRDIRDGVLRHLSGDVEKPIPPGSIVVASELSPSRFLACDWSLGGGVVLMAGSPSSHVAMLARSLRVPMVVGIGTLPGLAAAAIVDGDRGCAVIGPEPEELSAVTARIGALRQAHEAEAEAEGLYAPAMTADGVRVNVQVNISALAELATLQPECCDGVGLVRTEFLFGGPALPDEETQYEAYLRIAQWAGTRPVTIRALDVGGDKPAPGLSVENEANPFLGVRGIRLLLRHPDVFKTQLRALARAAAHGNVAVMLPMVTSPEEIRAARALLDEVLAQLRGEGLKHGEPPLGIMVEVPAVAMLAERYAASDFFSIGTNDLLQYMSASARDMTEAGPLHEAAIPAAYELIARIVAAGERLGRPVSLCGDLATETGRLGPLLATGLRSISVPPRKIGAVKLAIHGLRLGS